MTLNRLNALTTATLVATATAAHAHVGGTQGFALIDGLMHPLRGADHAAAALAVGLWAAMAAPRARLAWPAAFIALMLAGCVAALAGVALPGTELAIAASVMALGAAIALGTIPPVAAGVATCGAFAVMHGFAHGAEMPAGAASASYIAGLVIATALLHAAGVAFGLSVTDARLRRLAGAAVAVAGMAFAII